MRPELEEIKYIENYFLNKLSEEQKREFEERLKLDTEFAKNVKLQKILVKRVTRLGIKHTVALSHRKHTQRNTFLFKRRPNKNFFKSFFTLIMVLVVGYLIVISDTKTPDNKIVVGSVETIVPDSVLFRQKLDSLPETVFRFPVGDSLGHGYIITRKFNQYFEIDGTHLGIDISDTGPANSDLGDTIYSIGDGLVALAFPKDYLAIFYKYKGNIIKALYYHCDTVFCESGEFVSKGQAIATIETAMVPTQHTYILK